MTNAVNWFEIPVKNYERAKTFYSNILNSKIEDYPMPGDGKYGVFPYNTESNCVGGAIIESEGYTPSTEGALVYLNGSDDLSIALNKVEKAGGKIVMPKTDIGENGFIAHFLDTEGNKIAIHSME
ncbi:VOC family protein [uncultured Maribacter sp.]|uniref:VOC family protein n=1 Tax=uncultured Maribacter sp. TaxID=431308 RepID=UPI0026117661|nr:VOC family protein [uncultured Maribacter sp.]